MIWRYISKIDKYWGKNSKQLFLTVGVLFFYCCSQVPYTIVLTIYIIQVFEISTCSKSNLENCKNSNFIEKMAVLLVLLIICLSLR